MHNRLLALALAAALCAALAACGGARADGVTAPAITSTASTAPATPEVTAAPTAQPESDLHKALDDCLAFDADSAGGSLKSARAASGLLTALAANVPDTLPDDAAAWKANLSDKDKAQLAVNWPTISGTARAIAKDQDSQAGLLESAGIDTDFNKLDLTGIPAAFDTLDAAFLS